MSVDQVEKKQKRFIDHIQKKKSLILSGHILNERHKSYGDVW